MSDQPDLRDFIKAQFDHTNGLAFEREQRADARLSKIEVRLGGLDQRLERLTGIVERLAENVAGLDSSMVSVLQHVSNANAAHARTAREVAELRARVEELERRLPPAA